MDPDAAFYRAGLLATVLLVASIPLASAASVDLGRAGGGIAFTFSGGDASSTVAANILDAHGMRGTFYVVSTQLRQGPYYTAYVSASDVTNLSVRGHEIGSMTATQVDLTSVDAARLTAELRESQTNLAAISGKPVTQLAYPYGAVNDAVVEATSAYYASGRTISWTINDFTGTADPYHLPGFIMRKSTSLAEAKWIVDQAIARNAYVVLSFGAIVAAPNTYDWTPSDLDALATYVQSKGVPASTVSEMLARTPPPPATPPRAPTLTAAAGNASVDLTWTTPANGGSSITGFTIYRGTTAGSETRHADAGLLTSFRDVNVSNGRTYSYRVSATNAIGEGPLSNGVAVVPQPVTAPRGGTIVFTFDDGSKTHVAAGQTLAGKGFRGTFYIISDCPRSEVDTTLCMTTKEVQSLAQAGHDIASHTVKHVDLVAVNAKTRTSELTRSKSTLEALVGKPVNHIAYPYGSHNAAVRTETAKYYGTGRIFLNNPSVASLPNLLAQSGSDPYLVPGIGVSQATSLATAKQYVDYAIANNITLVLAFHDIMGSGGDEYTWTPANFRALVDYVASTKVTVKTMAQRYG